MVVIFPKIFVNGCVVYVQTWDILTLKTPSSHPKMFTDTVISKFESISVYFLLFFGLHFNLHLHLCVVFTRFIMIIKGILGFKCSLLYCSRIVSVTGQN